MSASDLAGHLACRHVTTMDFELLHGQRERQRWREPELQALAERGNRHEEAYLGHLEASGCDVLRLEPKGAADAAEQTRDALRAGREVIAQATLAEGRWLGIADVLRRVETPSELGAFSYEVVDTKLARETKGGTILQLCLYSELLATIQGVLPVSMHVVSPGDAFEPETFRVADAMAYYRYVKARLLDAVDGNGAAGTTTTYPEPCDHCDICDWRWACDRRRRDDDHLALVAGISRLQRVELEARGVATLAGLARMRLPLTPAPERGSEATYARMREQARVQLEQRETEALVHELLELEPGRGLARLPALSPGDVYLDFEGDRYVEDGGIEFLFGVSLAHADGSLTYERRWAKNRTEERAAFEWLIALIGARWQRHPDLHVVHFGAYEPATLKRLAGRYGTCQDELDRLLRGERLIDLHAVVREGLRAGVERYSLKDLEPFFGFERELDLEASRRALRLTQHALEAGDPDDIDAETMAHVERYNEDDCLATAGLRAWLETLRAERSAAGDTIERPELASGDPGEALEEHSSEVQAVAEALRHDVPDEREDRTEEQHARWLLAHLLEWHRRETKVAWWERFRLRDTAPADLLDERFALTGLEPLGQVGKVARSQLHRFRFPDQELHLSEGDALYVWGDDDKECAVGAVHEVDLSGRHLDVKMSKKGLQLQPTSVFFDSIFSRPPMGPALLELGQQVVAFGIDHEGALRAVRDLLLRRPPRLRASRPIDGALLPAHVATATDDEVLAAQQALVLDLAGGALPIQGPPGSGKTYTGARMILACVEAGLTVGVTALSHKAIANMLEEVVRAGAERKRTVRILRKPKTGDKTELAGVRNEHDNAKIRAELEQGDVDVVGGTPYLWSRADLRESLDILIVDEAGQLSLANVLAVGQAARNVVLLGDPRQLEQPQRGAHPEGADVSGLDHVLGEAATIDPRRGLLLDVTRRMHPQICAPVSELFYEAKLHAHPSLASIGVTDLPLLAEPGILYVPVEHRGNSSSSPEEVEVVARLVRHLIGARAHWTDREGRTQPLDLSEILVVAPYNAQVGALQRALPPQARVGTVDKFQGQEAAVVLFSLSSSTPADAPRGMEFLYSQNRLNVAISRARCNALLVGSPALFEPDCKTPRQIRLANSFCRLLELAVRIDPDTLARVPS